MTVDTILRPDTSLEKLAALKPVFGDTMTAGNSTALTDGAAVVLLAEQGWADANGLPALARVVDAQVAAVDHTTGDDLLLAPAHAAARLLARQGMGLQDFDLYELHEAFASTVLATLAAWESAEFCRDALGLDAPLGPIDRDRLNVTGSSLAAGHPFAATGGQDRRHPRQAAARTRHRRARAGIDLRRRRPGCRGDPRGALMAGLLERAFTSAPGRAVAGRLGLPDPPHLRRGRELPEGPVVLVSLCGSDLVADSLALLGVAAQPPVVDESGEATTYPGRIGAIVVDARGPGDTSTDSSC